MGKNSGGGERTGPSRRGRLRSQVLETPVEEMEGLLERLSDEYPSLERVDETEAEEAIEAEGELEEEERDEDSWDEDSEYGAEELEDEDRDGDEPEEEEDLSLFEEISGEISEEAEERPYPTLVIARSEQELQVSLRGAEILELWAFRPTGNPEVDQSGRIILNALREKFRHLHQLGNILKEEQREYFLREDDGERHLWLKPLTCAEVAEEMGVSNSTVVRLVKGAALQAPGIRWAPLGDLFNFSRQGYPVARRSIAQEIRRIIAGEDGRKPYSAGEIAAQLRARVEAATGKVLQISEKMVRNVMDEEDIPSRRLRRTQDR